MSIAKRMAGLLLFLALVCAVATSAQEQDGAKDAKPAKAKTVEIPALKMALNFIEAGEFEMGSPREEAGHQDNEFQHKVRLTRPFYLQTTAVTQDQYAAIMGQNPSSFHGGDLPVENVSWDDAVRFCEELSKRQGRIFRLPTEAEWEYAARAGKSGPVSGTGKLGEMAWYADNSGRDPIDSAKLWDTDANSYFKHLSDNGCGPHKIGTAKANDWGLYDMQGNMVQWVADWFSEDYFHSKGAQLDPYGPKESPLGSRVMRGGSWGSDPRNCRLAHRDWNVPGTRSGSCGFRVATD